MCYLQIQIFVSFVFSYDLVYVFIAKAFLFTSVIFKRYSQLINSCQKYSCGSQSVDIARLVRPAEEHAQDVLSSGLG